MLNQEQQIFEQINKAKNILVTFSRNWTGDDIASSLALFLFLKKINKKVDIVAENMKKIDFEKYKASRLFCFLPGFKNIGNRINNLKNFIISLNIANAKVKQIKYNINENDNKLNFIISPKDGFFSNDDVESYVDGFKYDLIITLNLTDLESLGKIYYDNTDFFYKTPIINIDHNPNNEEFGQINYVELTAVSTTEILFSLFESYSRSMVDEDIATCLLAGIIFKTKSFKTVNITPRTLLSSSQLMSIGARREEIVNKLYRSRSFGVLKLWGRVLAKLNSSLDNKLIWSILIQSDFIKTNTTKENLDDIVDELIVNIPQAKIIILIYEKIKMQKVEEIEIEFVVYSTQNINSLELIKEYNPSGTKKIAKFFIKKSSRLTPENIIDSIKEKLEKLFI